MALRLSYRRLYLRMALYIGVALAAFVALGIGSVLVVASQQLASYVAIKQSPLGQQAASVLARGGEPALERWLRGEADIPADVTVYVLDERSRDILGRDLPRVYRGFVREFVVGPPEQPGASYRPVHLAPQLVGPGGEIYYFLVLPNRINLWGSGATALGLVLAALLVIGSVAFFIARAFGRPIGELQLAVRELALGHTQARVPVAIANRRDELGALAADFNIMADKLEALLESRQRLMGELSHELRSPLARLQAVLALASHRQLPGAAERAQIEQEIGRMDAVIGDILRFSRLDAAATVSRRLVRLDRLIGDLVRDEAVEAAARGCVLVATPVGDITSVGDPELLRRGLENIVRNAIRYAPPGSAVEIATERIGDEVRIAVHDRGPGVPDEWLTRMFEPYVRVPNGTAGTGGTGLGLAIARRVFEVHDGRVAASRRPGGGLTVTAWLPAAELG